jgi:hypothetical protein
MQIAAVFPGTDLTVFQQRHPNATYITTLTEATALQWRRLHGAVQTDGCVVCHTHPQLLNQLEDWELPYYIVYPDADQKAPYLRRMAQHFSQPMRPRQVGRTTEYNFLRIYEAQWEGLLDDVRRRRRAHHLVLGAGVGLHDVLSIALGKFQLV